MTIFVNSILESNLGYSAVFACIGMGFLFLRRVYEDDPGPGYWALGFFLNSIGFLFWSGEIIPELRRYFLPGEVFHVAGFILMACGVYRFSGNAYSLKFSMAIAAWAAAWILSIVFLRKYFYFAVIMLKLLRATLFIASGLVIHRKRTKGSNFGKHVTGFSLIAWGVYTTLLTFIGIRSWINLLYGFLVGFQVLSAFGMVAMVVDRVKIRAEESERHVKQLEGLLPICSYCKKIRDKKNNWQPLELYIEERSTAEFSHGICPECFEKHRPDR